MAEEAKIGTTWQSDELDAIVADYFAMLEADLAGEPCVKSRHSAALMERIGRTHRSVEFKNQNISAVLDELGRPWIAGYKPKRNYQTAIFDTIDRYLTARPAVLHALPATTPAVAGPAPVLVAPPVLVAADGTARTTGTGFTRRSSSVIMPAVRRGDQRSLKVSWR